MWPETTSDLVGTLLETLFDNRILQYKILFQLGHDFCQRMNFSWKRKHILTPLPNDILSGYLKPAANVAGLVKTV